MVYAAGSAPRRMRTHSFPQIWELDLPGKSSLLLVFLETAFYLCHQSHPPTVPLSARQQIGSISQGRDEATRGWHSRLVVRTHSCFYFQAALSLTCADSLVGSPLEGVGPWLLACSPMNTKPRAFSDVLRFGLL